jgi:hypothetical protein
LPARDDLFNTFPSVTYAVGQNLNAKLVLYENDEQCVCDADMLIVALVPI